MKRVDIEGQFDPSNPWCAGISKKTPLAINRTQIGSHDQPSNWISFCNEVDTTLNNNIGNAKQIYYITSGITFILFLVLVNAQWWIRRFLADGDSIFIVSILISVIVLVFAVGLVTASCWIHRKLNLMFDQVSRVCVRYTVGNVVTYELRDEWWGGCSNFRARRRFIMVSVGDNVVANDVENQQNTVMPVAVSAVDQNYYSQQTTTTTQQSQNQPISSNTTTTTTAFTTGDSFETNQNGSGGNNSSSLFNQLSSGMK